MGQILPERIAQRFLSKKYSDASLQIAIGAFTCVYGNESSVEKETYEMLNASKRLSCNIYQYYVPQRHTKNQMESFSKSKAMQNSTRAPSNAQCQPQTPDPRR